MKIMKEILLIIVSTLFTHTLVSQQSDWIDKKQRFIEAYEDIFLEQENTKWLFKATSKPHSINLNYAPDPWAYLTSMVQLGVEHKVSPAFSLGLNFDYDTRVFGLSHSWTSDLSGRWYYRMKRLLKAGVVKNNLSENYFNFGIETGFRHSELVSTGIRVGWGMQRRVFNYGLVDFGFELKWSRLISDNYIESPTPRIDNQDLLEIGNKLRIGFGLSNKMDHINTKDFCSVLKCHRKESQQFKIDVASILNFRHQDNLLIGGSRIGLFYEFKLWDSPWSINTGIVLGLSRTRLIKILKHYTSAEKVNSSSMKLVIEPRYYYDLRKRILKGKSGNGLSANYFALHAMRAVNWSNLKYSDGSKSDYSSKYNNIGVLWGMQRRIFNHGFYDFNIGLGASTGDTNLRSQKFDWDHVDPLFIANFRAGIVF